MDGGDKPQVTIYSHDYENGHRDIPVGEFTSQHHATIAAISAQLSAVLPTGCRTRTPVLRLIEGGRAPD